MAKKEKRKAAPSAEAEKLKELENRLQRALADYDNLQKRIAEDRGQSIQFAKGELLLKLLSVLDTLEVSANIVQKEGSEAVKQGIDIASKEFKKVLQEEGVEEIGDEDEFDPRLHEAVSVVLGEDNKITDVVQKGYRMAEKILRPARVRVSKKSND